MEMVEVIREVVGESGGDTDSPPIAMRSGSVASSKSSPTSDAKGLLKYALVKSSSHSSDRLIESGWMRKFSRLLEPMPPIMPIDLSTPVPPDDRAFEDVPAEGRNEVENPNPENELGNELPSPLESWKFEDDDVCG